MKKQLGLLAGVLGGFCVLVCAGCGRRAEAPSAQGQLNPDVSHGQVRVVLLRAGPDASAAGQSKFVVTYGIEVPKQGAFSDLSIGGEEEVTLFVRGKAIDDQGGAASASVGFRELPRQSEISEPAIPDGRAMIFEDVTFTDLNINAAPIDIRIRFSWRGMPQSFEFRNVPVGYHNAERGVRTL